MPENIYEQYTELGISVIPIQPKTKDPYFDRLREVGWVDNNNRTMWAPAQRAIAGPEVLRQWFADGQAAIALVAGAVSGNLIYLDWDDIQSYKRWAMAHREIINQTAVSKTVRGYHVFFKLPEATSGQTLWFEDEPCGEVRGEGQYVVEWPSIHPSGTAYEWLRHPDQGIMEIASLTDIALENRGRNFGEYGEYDVPKVSMVDEALLHKVMAAKWRGMDFWRLHEHGDTSNYSTRSEGHLAYCRILAFWTGRDAKRIDQFFRQSRLFEEDVAKKWDRVSCRAGYTYGEMTIDLACRSTQSVYEVRQRPQWEGF